MSPCAPQRTCTPNTGDCARYNCTTCCSVQFASMFPNMPAICSMCWAEKCATAAIITTAAPTNATAPAAPTNATIPAAIAGIHGAFVKTTCTDPRVIRYVSKMLTAFTFEGHVGQLLLVYGTMALGQLAAIPTPTIGKPLGVAMWAAWVGCMLFQLLFVVLSLVTWFASFDSVRGHGCLVEWAHGYSMLDVMALMTSGFHPFLLANIAVLNFYAMLLVQAARVWCVTRYDRDVGRWWVFCNAFPTYLPSATFAWTAFTALMWLGSASVVFGFAFLPMALLQFLPLLAALYFTCWLHERTRGSKSALAKHAFSASTFPADLGDDFFSIGDRTQSEQEAGLFSSQLLMFLIAAFLAPMVYHGAHLAFFVYSGVGAAATTARTGQLYGFTYPGDISFPVIADLDPAKAVAAAAALLEASFDVTDLDTDALLASADGFLTLGFLVSLIKPVISALAAVLVFADMATKNVPTWKLGGDEDWDKSTMLRELGRTKSTADQAGAAAVTNPISKSTI